MRKEEVKRYGRRWWMEVGGVLTICWVFERRGKVGCEGLQFELLFSWD